MGARERVGQKPLLTGPALAQSRDDVGAELLRFEVGDDPVERSQNSISRTLTLAWTTNETEVNPAEVLVTTRM